MPRRNDGEHRWVAMSYPANEDRGQILGGFVENEPMVRQFNVHGTYQTSAIIPEPMKPPRPTLQGCECPSQFK